LLQRGAAKCEIGALVGGLNPPLHIPTWLMIVSDMPHLSTTYLPTLWCIGSVKFAV